MTPYILVDYYRYTYQRVGCNSKAVDLHPGSTWVGISKETPDFMIKNIHDILQSLQVNDDVLTRIPLRPLPVHRTSVIITFDF
jgi:hypothetical protein